MATLLIGYDLNKDKNYEPLWAAIKDAGTLWWHHLDSTWLIVTTRTPVSVRDELKKHMDSDDELLVIDVSGDAAAWKGFSDKGSTWLKTNL